MGPVAPMGVRWYLRRKAGHVYLVRVVFEGGRRREEWIGNVEEIHRIIREYRQRNPRPYRKPGSEGGVVRPPGFEPGTTGLGGRRPSPG